MNIGGPMAAVLTPRNASGQLDLDILRKNVAFVMERGSTGVCVNGATGEYTRSTLPERRSVVEAARQALAGGGLLLAGSGGATWEECYTVAAHAFDCGAHAVLVPAPHFFSYEDDDLEEFYTKLALRLNGPILLYNLPQFTTGLSTDLVIRLIHCVPSIAGIKDSSGSLSTLRQLRANGLPAAYRIVGHDGVLVEAFRESCLDGVISGVAGVVPELNVALYQAFASADTVRQQEVIALQGELVRALAPLPVPWALKVIATQRDLGLESFPLPLSKTRRLLIQNFSRAFAEWCKRAEGILEGWKTSPIPTRF